MGKLGQDYKDLIARLKELQAVRNLKSDWLLENDATPAAVRGALARFLDTNDRIVVSEVYDNASWSNLLVGDQVIKDLYARSAKRC